MSESENESDSRKSTEFPDPPDWARDAIWYQIFPERFRNGLPDNDPIPADIADTIVPGWHVRSWGSDWYALDKWERAMGGFWKSVFWRRYGGDLIGVREKLNYLQDLGVNALYLNPIFLAPSLHKYDAACLHHVDPTFGPDRAGDFQKLADARETEDPATWIWTSADLFFRDFLAEAHERGFRVIIDGVFNHCGRRFFAFQDVLKRGRASPYASWFKITRWNDDGTFEYQGWFGHKMLPEFAQAEDDLVPPVRQYIFDITRRWMDPDGDGDPSDGIDGWRLDVAFCVPMGFWRKWRRFVKELNPEAYLTAEIVGPADDYLRGDTFDAVMNYMWLFATINFFAPGVPVYLAALFRRRLNSLRCAYPAQALPVLQNLLDSHDVARAVSMFENLERPIEDFAAYFEFGRLRANTVFRTARPGPAAWQALRQAILFQMCYEGAPMLYYGTEVGLWGANDPCNRQPMLWEDVVYEDERESPHGPLGPTPRRPDVELKNFVKKAIGLRRACAPLRRGSLRWLRSPSDATLAFERRLGGEWVRAYFNRGAEKVLVNAPGGAIDLWQGVAAPRRVEIHPRGWLLLANRHYP